MSIYLNGATDHVLKGKSVTVLFFTDGQLDVKAEIIFNSCKEAIGFVKDFKKLSKHVANVKIEPKKLSKMEKMSNKWRRLVDLGGYKI